MLIKRLTLIIGLNVLVFSACKSEEKSTEVTPQPTESIKPSEVSEKPPSSPTQTDEEKKQESPQQQDFAKVEAVVGKPLIHRNNEKIPAKPDMILLPHDNVETAATTKIRIKFSDGSIISVGPKSKIALESLVVTDRKRSGSLKVLVGRFWMNVSKWAQPRGESLWEVSTPNAVAGIRGTVLWGDTQVDAICALEGQIEVRNLKKPDLKPASLDAGHCAAKLSKGKLAPLKPTPKQVKTYLKQVLIP